MSDEVEAAGAASVGGWLRWKRRFTVEPGTPCANCRTPLQGAYCHTCGQLAESYHRSLFDLGKEAFESFFHWDGRMVRTIPALILRPWRLTRDYLDGQRVAQVPPLRLYLVVVVVFFLVGGLTQSSHPKIRYDELGRASAEILPGADRPGVARANLRAGAVERWVGPRLKYAIEHQGEFERALDAWTHRVAVVLMPVAALLLGALFAFQRRFVMFDHLVFAMHSLSFTMLLMSAVSLLNLLPVGGAFSLLFLAAPVHLFAHMRGVYGTSVAGTLARMTVLFLGVSLALLLLVVGAVAAGLNDLPTTGAA